MKLVLAHDSLTQLGGAERVFFEMADNYPEAPIYTLVLDKKIAASLSPELVARIRTTPLQYIYNIYPKFQHLLPLIPLALCLTKIPACDILLSSSSGFAKGFKKPKTNSVMPAKAGIFTKFHQLLLQSRDSRLRGNDRKNGNDKQTIHINYCHTPTRFLWTDEKYAEQEVPRLLRPLAKLFLAWLKKWDLRAADEIDVFIANSKEVQSRIKKFYGRDADVIYPFIDTNFWQSDLRNTKDEKYFLIAGRLHAHKNNDLAILVCNQLKLNLHVVGTGRDEAHLKSIAEPTITFLGRVGDEELRRQYTNAQAYIYPQLEDFGLMPLEAAACGTPSIGLNVGGSKETIVPGQTGEWFSQNNEEQLKNILQNWNKAKYNKPILRTHANQFNKSNFLNSLTAIVSDLSGRSKGSQ